MAQNNVNTTVGLLLSLAVRPADLAFAKKKEREGKENIQEQQNSVKANQKMEWQRQPTHKREDAHQATSARGFGRRK